MYTIDTKWLPKKSQTIFWGQLRGSHKVFWIVWAFFRQPFCIYCIDCAYISYMKSIPP